MNNENPQEFVAGPGFTMKMTLTPKQYEFFKEWSAIVPTLYLLDICIVSATKLTEEQLSSQPRKEKLIKELRNLDRPNNYFSYLFAMMEKVSDSRGIMTADELRAQILEDMAALRIFFKNASVYEDDDFAIKFLDDLMGHPIEHKRTEHLSFLSKLNDQYKLYNSISPKHRLNKAKEIIQDAKNLSIHLHHPVVIITLACLYGNKMAKKLMKFKADPKKFDAENALADVLLISRYAKLKLQIEQLGRNDGPFKNVTFITDDSALMEIVRCFKPQSVKYQNKTDVRESLLTMTVEFDKLLSEAKENEYIVVADLLSEVQQPHTSVDS
jgi:hypothetical protein